MIAIIGAAAFGLGVFGAMVGVVEPRLSRRWVRGRLLPSVTPPAPLRTPVSDPLEVSAFLDTVTRSVESGSSLGHAIVGAADTYPALHRFTESITLGCIRGLDVAAAVDAADTDEWSPSERQAAQALALASFDNAAQVTRHGASLIRERIAFEEERATRSAQALASLRILTRSPMVVAALIVVMSADARHFLFTGPTGFGCLALGTSLQVIGRRWMMRSIGDLAA